MSHAKIEILNKKEEIQTWINEGKNNQEICGLLNCKYNTLKKYLKILNIDIEPIRIHVVRDIEFYFQENFYIGGTNQFKYRLIKEGYKEHKCEKCNGTSWLDSIIPIELHHIDGNRKNNLLNNLQILCPNCHTLTDNYKSKNITNVNDNSHYCNCGNIKGYTTKYCKKCYYNNKKEEIKENDNKIIKKEYYKKICNKCNINTIRKNSNMCRKCRELENRIVERPFLEILLIDVENLGYLGTGRKYNVSDTSIRKWIKRYKEKMLL